MNHLNHFQVHRVCVNMGASDKFFENHSILSDSVLDDSFIERNKYQYIVDKIPKVTLRKLSEDDFKNGIIKLMELDVSKIKRKTHGKILYIELSNRKIPVLYNLLCQMVLHADPYVRLNSFYDNIEDYYNKVLSKHDLAKDQLNAQVRLFLPYAKLERLYQLCKEENVMDIEQAALEIEECILYPELNREECCVILKNIYKSEEVELFGFDAVQAMDLPGNLGKYFKIELISKDGTEIRTNYLFAKNIDKDNLELSEFSLLPFKKERYFFETMLESCKQFGIVTDFCPKCYYATNDMLVFEDIAVKGYSSWNFHVPVSYDWLVTTVSLLAKLHAMSIIFEEKLSEKLGRTARLDEEYPNYLCEAAFLENEEYKCFRDSYRRSICEYLLSKFLDVPKKIHTDALREKVKDACRSMYEISNKSNKIRNVLNHGDMWGANIMYKEDEVTQTPSAYLIDFQLTRYCPPSVDLMFLLYANTDRSTRVKHQKDFIELYYKEITHILSCYDVNIGNIISFEQLMESCKEVEPMIICRAVMYGELMLMPEKHKKEMMSDKERSKEFFAGDRAIELEKVWHYDPLRTRIGGLVEDLIQIYEAEI